MSDSIYSIPILTKALAKGIEVALSTPYAKWEILLEKRESIGDTLLNEGGSEFATFELLPVQQFDESTGSEIEIRIAASDGLYQEKVYWYVRSAGLERAS